MAAAKFKGGDAVVVTDATHPKVGTRTVIEKVAPSATATPTVIRYDCHDSLNKHQYGVSETQVAQ